MNSKKSEMVDVVERGDYSSSQNNGIIEPSYAVVLIKPDALRDFLEGMILRDLHNEAEFKVILQKYWKVKEENVAHIYPDWTNKSEFPAMVYNITQDNSLFILVEGGQDIHEVLKKAKGKMNKGGLRLKYRTHSIEEWKSIGYSGFELQKKLAENRLHTTDDISETISLCSLALTSSDLDILHERVTSLADAIRRRTAIKIWKTI